MKRILTQLALAAILAATGLAQPTPQLTTGPTVFAYFKEPGNQGVYFALSRDGYTFTPLNDGQPWLKPTAPGEIMRDIYVTRTLTGDGFRAVWTWAWKGSTLGTASSSDLFTWSQQSNVPIMKDFPTVRNVWAPETYWDAQANDWLLIWSSAVDGITDGNRIWASHTRDFATFSKPAIFYDPGFVVIDATMFHRTLNGRSDFVFVVKDQSTDPLRYAERWTSGPTVEGPWAPLSGPINQSWSEGPSVIQVGDKSIVYYDHYRAPRARYEGVATTDWVHWTSVNDKMRFPDYAKHGSFFQITEAEANRLLSRHDPAPSAP
ncbi:MAG: glycoside hydrolase family 43 protein [Acidobacteriota bacterium]|nr:glycoside hydrolase family 43 protein [Acidobacteriota bacterium]